MLKTRRRSFIPLLLALALATNVSTLAAGKCFMWEAKKGKATVYLLGTIHMGKKEMYPPDAAITDAFKKSDYLVLEVNSSSPTAMAEAQTAMMKYGMYLDGSKLEDKISRQTLSKLNAYLKKKGTSIPMISTMRPWVIAMTLLKYEVYDMDVSETYGLESYLVRTAGDKTVLELETMENQMKLLGGGTDMEQDLALSEALDNLPNTKTLMNKMINAWINGDTGAMEEVMQTGVSKNPQLRNRNNKLIFDRNTSMANKISEYFKTDKTYFVAIGSAHLVGKKGVVQQLQAKGINSRQLSKTSR